MQIFKDYRTKEPQEIQPEQVVNIMRSDEELKQKTQLHRTLRANGQESQSKMVKESTPQIAVAFRMEGGKAKDDCRECTYRIPVDFDAKEPGQQLPPEELERVKTILRTSRHAEIGCESISGLGYKIIVPYKLPEGVTIDLLNDRERSEKIYKRVCQVINRQYTVWCGHPMDSQCANINRMFGLSHDPLAVYRPNAVPFRLTKEDLGIGPNGGLMKLSTPKYAVNEDGSRASMPLGDHLETATKKLEEQGFVFAPGSRHDFVMRLSFMLNREGVDENEAAQALDEAYLGRMDERPSAILHSCYKTASNEFGILMPKPKKTAEEKQQEKAKDFKELIDEVQKGRTFRCNVVAHRPEVSTDGGMSWTPWTDRHLDTLLTTLRANGKKAESPVITSIINSIDVSPDFNPLVDWLNSLPEWHEGDHDYVNDFLGYFEFMDEEYTDFYHDAMRTWLRAFLAHARGLIDVNAQILMFVGGEHIGKSHMAKQILPPCLREYQAPVNPYKSLSNTDSEIAASEKFILILDELDINSDAKSNQLKFSATQSGSYERSAYDRYRQQRQNVASRIGTTNHLRYIREEDGNRRYLTVNLKGTKNTVDNPINYEGLYSQLLYEVNHGYKTEMTHEDSMAIKEHNSNFMMLDNTLEAVKLVVRKPEAGEEALAMTPADIQKLLIASGYRGTDYHVNRIGKALTKMDLEKRHGRRGTVYMACRINTKEIDEAQRTDAGQTRTDDAGKTQTGNTEQSLPF